jgi:hypothetical protein
MGWPSLVWAVFNDLHGQPHDAVMCELIATDEPGGQFGTGIYHWSQFLSDRSFQITQPVIEKPDADGVGVVGIIGFAFQAEIADVLVAPLIDGILAAAERDASQFGLSVRMKTKLKSPPWYLFG